MGRMTSVNEIAAQPKTMPSVQCGGINSSILLEAAFGGMPFSPLALGTFRNLRGTSYVPTTQPCSCPTTGVKFPF